MAQVLLVLMAEAAYFAHYLISNIKVSLSLRITEILTEVFIIIFLSMRLLVNTGAVSEESRNGIVATIMVVCVYGIIIVSICFALYTLVVLLVQSCIKLLKYFKKHSAVSDKSTKTANQTELAIQEFQATINTEQYAIGNITTLESAIRSPTIRSSSIRHGLSAKHGERKNMAKPK